MEILDADRTLRLFLCGDVMTGRGIDQILPHPSKPRLFESCVRSARTYVELAEQVSGPIPRRVAFDYIWGDALAEIEKARPQARIVNLETAITRSDDAWPGKGVHYRMHPANVPCLTAAKIDCCVLANNHVLDWGRAGLEETLATLAQAGLGTCGAGRDAASAAAPAIVGIGDGRRVLVFAAAHGGSGVPADWRAGERTAGVNRVADLSARSVEAIAKRIAACRRPKDLVVYSIHWGGNWGYRIAPDERDFAHALIDRAGVDVLHGHSSHHVKGIEIYRRKLILYGCGDLLNDYEGIGGHEEFRSDLSLMYFAALDRDSGDLAGLTMTPTRMRRFQIRHAAPADAAWLLDTMQRECGQFGATVALRADGVLEAGFAH